MARWVMTPSRTRMCLDWTHTHICENAQRPWTWSTAHMRTRMNAACSVHTHTIVHTQPHTLPPLHTIQVDIWLAPPPPSQHQIGHQQPLHPRTCSVDPQHREAPILSPRPVGRSPPPTPVSPKSLACPSSRASSPPRRHTGWVADRGQLRPRGPESPALRVERTCTIGLREGLTAEGLTPRADGRTSSPRAGLWSRAPLPRSDSRRGGGQWGRGEAGARSSLPVSPPSPHAHSLPPSLERIVSIGRRNAQHSAAPMTYIRCGGRMASVRLDRMHRSPASAPPTHRPAPPPPMTCA